MPIASAAPINVYVRVVEENGIQTGVTTTAIESLRRKISRSQKDP